MESLSDFHKVAAMLRQCQEIVRQHSPEVVQVVSAYHMSGLDASKPLAPNYGTALAGTAIGRFCL